MEQMSSRFKCLLASAAIVAVGALPAGAFATPAQDWPWTLSVRTEAEAPASADYWAALTPEERERMRSQIREHAERLPPEERQRRREDMRERWERMSPEDREQIREAIRQNRFGGHTGPGGPGPGGQGRH